MSHQRDPALAGERGGGRGSSAWGPSIGSDAPRSRPVCSLRGPGTKSSRETEARRSAVSGRTAGRQASCLPPLHSSPPAPFSRPLPPASAPSWSGSPFPHLTSFVLLHGGPPSVGKCPALWLGDGGCPQESCHPESPLSRTSFCWVLGRGLAWGHLACPLPQITLCRPPIRVCVGCVFVCACVYLCTVFVGCFCLSVSVCVCLSALCLGVCLDVASVRATGLSVCPLLCHLPASVCEFIGGRGRVCRCVIVPACARRFLGVCLSGGFGCLAVLACLSVPRRQEHRAGGR
ncbi:hypothetical protein HJG60_010992 [Phyllostomus discolor]|uniref:Uncharacterized protein n=1 Tax=Phyllostomus discolor TaxID=89673 RepID=A0A834EAE4_9CHIR|nr:hypothetical protein HJG60_010992 [Phyllostomus discolor]